MLARTAVLLDEQQRAAVAAVAGTDRLAVVVGPAGAGKTSVLATAERLVRDQGGRLVVVAPSRVSAMVASREIGCDTDTAHALVHAHGWRWDDDGVWHRLTVGEFDPDTNRVYTGPGRDALRRGDVLVVDEAGMLDQATARALPHVADEADVRVRGFGDAYQLSAIGRGGVLEYAAAATARVVELDTVHRFRTLDGGRDTGYADLSLAIRTGTGRRDVGGRGRRRRAVPPRASTPAPATADTGRAYSQAAIVATKEQAEQVNALVRDRLVTEHSHVLAGTTEPVDWGRHR